MKIYDISMKIHSEMPVYKNRDHLKPVREIVKNHTNSDFFSSNIKMNMHAGTHLDAPLHMLKGGTTIDQTDLSKIARPCFVVDLTDIEDRITKDALLDKNINKGEFVLFKTKNSHISDFYYEYVFLDKSGAEYLNNLEITGVGIDSLSIGKGQENHETHKILLRSGIIILEGLRLKEVNEGNYFLVAAPLKISNAEASPVRAILIDGLD